jgi:hypothetical protein
MSIRNSLSEVGLHYYRREINWALGLIENKKPGNLPDLHLLLDAQSWILDTSFFSASITHLLLFKQ